MAKISQNDINIFRALVKNVREVFEEVSTQKENSPKKWINYSVLFVSFIATVALLYLLYFGINLVLYESKLLLSVFIPILGTCILILVLSKQIWLNRMEGGNFLFCFFGFVWLISFIYVIGVCYLVFKHEFDVSMGLNQDPRDLLRSSLKEHFANPSLGKVIAVLAAIMASTPPIIFGIYILPERKKVEFEINDVLDKDQEDTRAKLALNIKLPVFENPTAGGVLKKYVLDEKSYPELKLGFIELYKEIVILRATNKFMIDSLERFNIKKDDIRENVLDIIRKSSLEARELDEHFIKEIIAKVKKEF